MLGINESVEKKINIDSSKDFNLSQWHGIQAYKGWMRNINLVFRAKKTLEDKKKEEEAEAIKEKVAEFKKDLDK